MSSLSGRLSLLCALALLALPLTPHPVQARVSRAAVFVPPQSAIIVDAATGRVLYAEAPDAPRYPASLTKLMTLYLTFDALDSGRLKLDEEIPVSAHAAAQEPSKIGFAPGSEITVQQAILSIVTKSANDAAVVLGEALGGDESDFARLMTAKAKSLGMRNTIFENASGLPDPRQHTTARDMATLAMAILHHHRNYYHFFSVPSFTFDGRRIDGHDHLLGSFQGVDGLKTGYIHASGFNLVTSAKRGDERLVGVVFGGVTYRSRDEEMRHLLTSAFTEIDHGSEMRVAAAVPASAIAPTVAMVSAPAAAEPAAHERVNEAAVIERHRPHLRPTQTRPLEHRVAAHEPPSHPVRMAAADRHTRGDDWVIQVGAYNRADLATRQAERAIKAAPAVLRNQKVGIEVPHNHADRLYRARLAGLSEDEARTACRILQRKQVGCLVLVN